MAKKRHFLVFFGPLEKRPFLRGKKRAIFSENRKTKGGTHVSA